MVRSHISICRPRESGDPSRRLRGVRSGPASIARAAWAPAFAGATPSRKAGAAGLIRRLLAPAAALFAALTLALPAAAEARKSYNFIGLEWGAGIEASRARLAKAGFQFVKQTDGQQEEFIVNGLHAAIATVDRGKRVIATGRIAGQPVQVDLAFDKEERLHHVIVTSKFWDGTIPGAKVLVDLSTRIVMLYEERYGPAIKRKEDGWVDTALWPRAGDGSLLAVYVRGTEGFMFSPSYKTALRVDFVGGKIAETSKIEMPPEPEKEPPKPKPLTKQELRKEYEKDPSVVEPPPPSRPFGR